MRSRDALYLLLGAGLLWSTSLAGAEVTKQQKVELSGADARSVGVENLVGKMTVGPGAPGRIVVTATVHAESRDLAEAVRLERPPTGGTGQTLRVRYPLDRVSRLRYPFLDENEDIPSFLKLLAFNHTRQEYDGHSVRIGDRGGSLLYVDVDVRLPPDISAATFRNLVGRIDAEGVGGKLSFQTTRADIGLERVRGEIRIEGTSGDIRASNIEGSWESHFTSGDCDVTDFRGSSFVVTASSGDLRARSLKAGSFSTRTTSGDITVSDSEVKDLECHATSGDLVIELRNPDLARVQVRTTSGDVTLRLPSSAAFEAVAEHGSGDVRVDFPDTASVERQSRRERYRHGSGGGRIDVRTGSGDFTLASR
jgi:hypothetical protein